MSLSPPHKKIRAVKLAPGGKPKWCRLQGATLFWRPGIRGRNRGAQTLHPQIATWSWGSRKGVSMVWAGSLGTHILYLCPELLVAELQRAGDALQVVDEHAGCKGTAQPTQYCGSRPEGHPTLAQDRECGAPSGPQGVLHPGPGQELQYILSPAGGSRHLQCLSCLARSLELVSPPRGQWDCWEEELASVGDARNPGRVTGREPKAQTHRSSSIAGRTTTGLVA